MDEIARKKADIAGDNRLWSPIDALEDAMATLKTKDLSTIELAVHWLERMPDGSSTHHYVAANLPMPEHLALLKVADHRLIHEWIK